MNAIRSCDAPFLNLIKSSWGANRGAGESREGFRVSCSVALQDAGNQAADRHMKIVTGWRNQAD